MEATLSGWLSLEDPELKTFEDRFFLVRGDKLIFAKDEQSIETNPSGQIDLPTITACNHTEFVVPLKPEGKGFEILTTTGSVHVLLAPNAEELAKWANFFAEYLSKKNQQKNPDEIKPTQQQEPQIQEAVQPKLPESDTSKFIAEIAAKDHEITELKNSLQAAVSEVQKLKDHLNNAESENQRQVQHIETITQDLAAQKRKFNERNTELEGLQAELASARAEIAEKNASVQSLTKNLQELENAKVTVPASEDVIDLQNTSVLSAEIESLKKDRASSIISTKSYESELKDSQAVISQLKAELQVARDDIKQQQNFIKAAKIQQEEAEEMIAAYEEEIENFREQLGISDPESEKLARAKRSDALWDSPEKGEPQGPRSFTVRTATPSSLPGLEALQSLVQLHEELEQIKHENLKLQEENEVHQHKQVIQADHVQELRKEVQSKDEQILLLHEELKELRRHSNPVGKTPRSDDDQAEKLMESVRAHQSQHAILLDTLQQVEKEKKMSIAARDKILELQRNHAQQWRYRYEELLRKILIMEGVSTEVIKEIAELKKSYFTALALSIKVNLSQKGKPFKGFDVTALYSQADQLLEWTKWEEWLLERAKEMANEVQIQPTTYFMHY